MSKDNKTSLRKWRQSVSGDFDYTRTLQFPLEFNPEQKLPDFSKFEKLYNTLHGAKKGTLAGLVCALHLSGFRFFGASNEAEPFAAHLSNLNTSFSPLHEIGFKKSFTPNELEKFLVKERRKNNDLVSEDTIKKEKLKFLKEYVSSSEGNAVNIVNSFFDFIHKEFEKYSEFKYKKDNEQTNKKREYIFNRFIEITRKAGIKLDNDIYKQMLSENVNIKLPESSTIVFDKDYVSEIPLAKLEDNPYLLHYTVAHVLAHKNPSHKFQEAFIPGTNSASLQWIFNKGLEIWQKQTTEEICTAYSVPQEYKHNIDDLKSWFIDVKKDNNILSKSYADYRSDIGGTLNSWTENYIKRLEKLSSNDIKINLPDFKDIPDDVKRKFPYAILNKVIDRCIFL